jgi:DNA invertase Pin-like site-specific DNA recombinase
MKPKFYGYSRASTAGQEYTYEAQRKAIQAAYETRFKETHDFGGWHEDHAVSGGKPFTERPEGLKLWVLAQPGDVICFSKMDRAFRNLADLCLMLQLSESKKISLQFLDLQLDTGTPLGKFVAHLLGSVAELERHWVSTRTKEAYAVRRDRGLPHGKRPPAGWKKNSAGEWDADNSERALIKWAIDQHDNKFVSYAKIIKYIKSKGLRRANGDGYHEPWLVYAVKAAAAGYPMRDGWRELMQRGGSIKRNTVTHPAGKAGGHRPNRVDDLARRAKVSSLPCDPSLPPGQTPEMIRLGSGHQTQTSPPSLSLAQSTGEGSESQSG